MKKFLLFLIPLIFFICGARAVFAQQKQPVSSLQEDCGVIFSFTAQSSGAQAPGNTTSGSTGTTPVIDNRQVGCVDWLVTYSTTSTISGISLAFQTAADVAGVPGTWANYPGTLTTGINPNTAATSPWAITDATGSAFPFLRMNLTSLTGTGTVYGKLYGWKRRPTYVSVTAGGGCVGTNTTPCVVDGPTAAGSPPTFPPVLVAGQDGTPGNIRTLKTNSTGNLDPAGLATAQADGASNTPNVPSASGAAATNQFYGYHFNGATWDRLRGNTSGTFVQGPVAGGVAVAGNPVQVGGPFFTTQPTVTNGQMVPWQFTARGAGIVATGVDPLAVTACPSGTPCAVDGPTAAGSPPTTPPVLVAGQDGSPGNIQTMATDSSGHPLIIQFGNPTVVSGQQAVTSSDVALATNTSKTICVKALKGNAANVYIGPSGVSTANGMELAAGDAYCAAVQNTNEIHVIAAAGGSSVSWIATN